MVDAREDEGAVRGLNIIEYVDVPQNNAKADLVIGYAFLDRVHTVVTCQGLLMNTNLSKKNFLDWVPFIQCVMEFFTQIHLAYFNKLQVGFDYQLLPSLVVNNNHPLFETKHVDWAWCPEWSLGFIPGQDKECLLYPASQF